MSSPFLGTLGANADFYDPFQENARRWYRESRRRTWRISDGVHCALHDGRVGDGS
jgi:hypothetical protein